MSAPFVCPECGCQTEVDGMSGVCRRCNSELPRKPGAWKSRVIAAAMWVCFLLVAVALFLPATGSAKEAAKRSTCRNNLKQIGLALLNYHVKYGSYPPAYIADSKGQPMHSWRVLILPFIEHDDLYAEYDFAQPWNSEHNMKLAARMPREFHCPGAQTKRAEKTSYVAANGPGYFFDRDHCRRESEVRDGLSNSIAVLDDARRELVWLDPSDGVAAMDAKAKVDGKAHPNGLLVLMVDGSVRYLTSDIMPENFAKLLTISGGERLDEGVD